MRTQSARGFFGLIIMCAGLAFATLACSGPAGKGDQVDDNHGDFNDESSDDRVDDDIGADRGDSGSEGTGDSSGTGGSDDTNGDTGDNTDTGDTGGTGGDGQCSEETTHVPELVPIATPCRAVTGALNLETAELCVSLDPDSQTIVALSPKSDPTFDFSPGDRRVSRSGAGYMHLGDVDLRWRVQGESTWQIVTTSASRTPVLDLGSAPGTLAAADLSPALPPELPFTITRSWATEGGRLAMRFELTNTSGSQLEVGALGFPMVFNNIISDRSLEEAHEVCSFSDPYVGRDAGYLQVTRLNGQGPAMLVLPASGTSFEAYNEILNPAGPESGGPTPPFTDLTPRTQTFEGFHEWMVHSGAYADNEWAGVDPWNPPTTLPLAPGESKTYGLTFLLADTIRAIENTLAREQRPAVVGIPGYVLPQDLEAQLFIDAPSDIESITVNPPGAITITQQDPTENCWRHYTLVGSQWGRARVTVRYADQTVQTLHYHVIDAMAAAVSNLGNLLTTKAWFTDLDDPFARSPSVMTYDREDGIVTQTKQAWVCGLGDDGGATWLAGIMKLLGQPDANQVQKYEQFVDGPLWGGLQYDEGALMYGVKRTLFYYEPSELPPGYYDSSIDWSTWMSWPRAHTEQVPRSYNYPHVAALYWTMYRLARNYEDLVANHPWDWYLDHAYQTVVAMTTIGNQYAQFGLMDGSIFLEILKDLQREGMTQQAADLESRMRSRADLWATQDYPFGSEMPWDSTGQEEVYTWTKYFGDTDKAKVTLDAITGYMPAIPHWGYNGCARRYWDFIYGGAKIDRLERMLHHYGSSLNAIPVLSEYRDHPEDLHLLRIGYAGMMGPLSNIDQEGAPSMAFHAFADTLAWDTRSGDYGLAFFGHAQGAASYLIAHQEFGWQAFGGNVEVNSTTVQLTPLDAFRKRIYLANVGLWLTLDAGRFERVELDTSTNTVRVGLAVADDHTPSARLRLEQPGPGPVYEAPAGLQVVRDAFIVPLSSEVTWVELAPI